MNFRQTVTMAEFGSAHETVVEGIERTTMTIAIGGGWRPNPGADGSHRMAIDHVSHVHVTVNRPRLSSIQPRTGAALASGIW